jgi:hypothetical protein
VLQILDTQGYEREEMIYRAVQYYVRQCITQDPFGFINGYLSEIELADSQVTELNDAMQAVGTSTLELICGRNFDDIASLAPEMLKNLGTLQQSALDTLNLLKCDNIVPIYYTSTIYDGTCTYSVTGVTWTFAGEFVSDNIQKYVCTLIIDHDLCFAAFLVIAFMGMIMIMFRSSYLEVEETEAKGVFMGESVADYAVETEPHYLPTQYTKDTSATAGVSAEASSYAEPESSYADPAYYGSEPAEVSALNHDFDADYRNSLIKASAPPEYEARTY